MPHVRLSDTLAFAGLRVPDIMPNFGWSPYWRARLQIIQGHDDVWLDREAVEALDAELESETPLEDWWACEGRRTVTEIRVSIPGVDNGTLEAALQWSGSSGDSEMAVLPLSTRAARKVVRDLRYRVVRELTTRFPGARVTVGGGPGPGIVVQVGAVAHPVAWTFLAKPLWNLRGWVGARVAGFPTVCPLDDGELDDLEREPASPRGLWEDLQREPWRGLIVTPMEAAALLVELFHEEISYCVDLESLRDVVPAVLRLLDPEEVGFFFEVGLDLRCPNEVHDLMRSLTALPAPARRRLRPEHLRPLLAHRDPDVRLFALQYLGTLSPRAGRVVRVTAG